ncbi:MAG: hypothetical protein C4290_15285, partial [Chloroflexota bacterium]
MHAQLSIRLEVSGHLLRGTDQALPRLFSRPPLRGAGGQAQAETQRNREGAEVAADALGLLA